jgi:hypothetical protein
MSDFGSLLLAQGGWDTNWFSTLWLISVGVTIGLVVVGLYLLKISLLSRIGGLNRIGESPAGFWIGGLLTGSVLAGLLVWAVIWLRPGGWEQVSGPLVSASPEQRGDGYLTIIFPAAFGLLVGFAHWVMASRKRVSETLAGVREGFLGWVGMICFVLAGFAAMGYLLHKVNGFGIIRFTQDADALLHSLARMPVAGPRETSFTVSPSSPTHPGDEIPVDFPGEEFRGLQVESNQSLEIAAQPLVQFLPSDQLYRIPPTSASTPALFRRGQVIPDGPVTKLYVANRGRNPATVKLVYFLLPVYPEVMVIPIAASSVVGLYLLVMSLTALFPKVSAIGLSTFKTEVSQPVFYLILAAGACFVMVSIFLPYNTFGEDIKMYKDSGLTLIRVLAIGVAIWAASKSVAEEIEGRTALTVLSKPVGRRQFIFGKILGISQVVGLVFIGLGLWFVLWTAYKPIYDAVETSKGATDWAECFRESTSVIPGLLLAFFETILFVIISVMISTRLGMLPNIVICFAIYVLGHITPLLVMSSSVVSNFEPVVFFGRLIAIVFPVLDNFSAEASIMTNEVVPVQYLFVSLLYTILYGSVGVLLALVLFEDRDLA